MKVLRGQFIAWTKGSSVLFFCASALLAPVSATAAKSIEQPNIVFILTDDMGYGDLGCYGGKLVPTPNIDKMAEEGTRFTQYYSASPVCSPSRTGLLTGMYPARWKITSYLQSCAGNRSCEQDDFLDPKASSIARMLKTAGYATGHFGKWHMGGGRDVTNAPPFSAYGFDEHASTWESPEPDPNLTATNWIWSAQDKIKRWDRTAYFVDKTLDFLKRHKDQPCYVNLWPDDVHTPWVPNGAKEKRHNTEEESEPSFKAVLAEYDRQIGRFLAGLKELGIDEKTLVVFTSDNGPMPSFEGVRSGGFRGCKISLYEGGTRMPCIVRWPGHAPARRVDEKGVFVAVDFFPTFCRLAGVSLPKDAKFDGNDVSDLLRGKTAMHHGKIFWEYGRSNASGFKYPTTPGDRSPNLAVRDGNWKLLINADGSQAELYDLTKDPAEKNNLADKETNVAKRLTQAVLNWRKSLP